MENVKINEDLGKKLNQKKEVSIEVKNLVKIYDSGPLEVLALRGLNAKFYRGEIVVIEGPSGCGKTTLVNIIGGLDRQNAGDIYFYENHYDNHKEHQENMFPEDIERQELSKISINQMSNRELELFRRERIGIVFQFMNLIPTLSAIENVKLPLVFKDIGKEQQNNKANYLLKVTKMDERAKHKPDQLSGGEQQRIAIAAALVNDPDIIIADEPTGNLDSKTAEEILDLFKNLIQKYPEKTLIIVSHDHSVRRIADRILFIKDGQIYDERNTKSMKIGNNNYSCDANEEIKKYQQKIIDLERKLNKMKKLFEE